MSQTVEITANVVMSILHHFDIAGDLIETSETETEKAYYKGIQVGLKQLLTELGIFITDVNHFPTDSLDEVEVLPDAFGEGTAT